MFVTQQTSIAQFHVINKINLKTTDGTIKQKAFCLWDTRNV